MSSGQLTSDSQVHECCVVLRASCYKRRTRSSRTLRASRPRSSPPDQALAVSRFPTTHTWVRRNRMISAIAIANFHGRPEIPAISGTSLKKKRCDVKLRLSIAGDCGLILRIPSPNRALSAEFLCNFKLAFARENHRDCETHTEHSHVETSVLRRP